MHIFLFLDRPQGQKEQDEVFKIFQSIESSFHRVDAGQDHCLHRRDHETDAINDYENIEPGLLRQAISELRPDEQAVIIATEFEDRTYEELSEEWDVPMGTLMSRKHRSLSKLHRILTTKQK